MSRSWRWLPVVGYAVVIVLLTLTSRRGTSGALTPSFVPLASIRELIDTGSRIAVVNNMLGNLLLFAPFAVLVRTLLVRSARWTLVVVLLASCFVELVQGLGIPDGRQANVDDVLLNVAGAAGALLLLRLARSATMGE